MTGWPNKKTQQIFKEKKKHTKLQRLLNLHYINNKKANFIKIMVFTKIMTYLQGDMMGKSGFIGHSQSFIIWEPVSFILALS